MNDLERVLRLVQRGLQRLGPKPIMFGLVIFLVLFPTGSWLWGTNPVQYTVFVEGFVALVGTAAVLASRRDVS